MIRVTAAICFLLVSLTGCVTRFWYSDGSGSLFASAHSPDQVATSLVNSLNKQGYQASWSQGATDNERIVTIHGFLVGGTITLTEGDWSMGAYGLFEYREARDIRVRMGGDAEKVADDLRTALDSAF